MKKRLFCLFLALLLAGCGTAAPAEVPTQSVEIPSIEEPTQAPEVPPATEDPADWAGWETQSPSAEPTLPEPTEDPLEVELAAILADMTTEEKVAQLFFVTPEALTGISGAATVAGQTTKDAFAEYPVGGILYMGQNLVSPEQVRQMLARMQEISLERLGLPVLLGVDEEGGSVARISGNSAFPIGPFPDAVSLDGDPARAAEIGAELGAYLYSLGFNLDFAPVADVLTNPDNTAVRTRAYSSDPEVVCTMCAAFSGALTDAGVLPCYKHFPGHGATAADSHQGFAGSDRSLEELRACELLPFRDAVQRGIPMIMVGHITLPQVTGAEVPASLSSELITGLLREELSYEGVVITDALNMGAITQYYTAGEAAVQAILAGNDMLLFAGDLPEAYQSVLEAVESGEISMERLDASVLRILRLKLTELP